MGKSLYDIFQDIHNMVQEQVDEKDKKGFAELYKAAAERFFAQCQEAGFHPTNIEYLSGYFIFGFGTNSVVHYSLEECPGWRFALWFGEPNKEHNFVPAEWFTQFEETIDKFKPTASEFVESINIYGTEEDSYGWDWKVKALTEFIRDEPDLAFCRDYCGWDYNMEYHTREEAHDEYVKWQNRERLKAEGQQLYLHKIVEALVDNLPEEAVNSMYLLDRGDYISPRYEFGYYNPDIDFEDEENLDRTSGLYGYEDICSTLLDMSDEDIAKIEAAIKAVNAWRESYCEENDCYFWGEADTHCWIATTEPWPEDTPTLKQFLSAE